MIPAIIACVLLTAGVRFTLLIARRRRDFEGQLCHFDPRGARLIDSNGSHYRIAVDYKAADQKCRWRDMTNIVWLHVLADGTAEVERHQFSTDLRSRPMRGLDEALMKIDTERALALIEKLQKRHEHPRH